MKTDYNCEQFKFNLSSSTFLFKVESVLNA